MRDRHQTALCMSSRGDGAREEGGRRREEEEEQERAKGRKEGGEGCGRHSGPGDRDSREPSPVPHCPRGATRRSRQLRLSRGAM